MAISDKGNVLRDLVDRLAPSLLPGEVALLRQVIETQPIPSSSAQVVVDAMIAFDREIAHPVLALLPKDPDAAARLMVQIKGRVQAIDQFVMNFGGSGPTPAVTLKTDDRALIHLLERRTARILGRDYSVLQAFTEAFEKLGTKTNSKIEDIHLEANALLEKVQSKEPQLADNSIYKHLAGMKNFGLLRADNKGLWRLTPLGSSYHDKIPDQLKSLGKEISRK